MSELCSNFEKVMFQNEYHSNLRKKKSIITCREFITTHNL